MFNGLNFDRTRTKVLDDRFLSSSTSYISIRPQFVYVPVVKPTAVVLTLQHIIAMT